MLFKVLNVFQQLVKKDLERLFPNKYLAHKNTNTQFFNTSCCQKKEKWEKRTRVVHKRSMLFRERSLNKISKVNSFCHEDGVARTLDKEYLRSPKGRRNNVLSVWHTLF